jgi:hypothetical protein
LADLADDAACGPLKAALCCAVCGRHLLAVRWAESCSLLGVLAAGL